MRWIEQAREHRRMGRSAMEVFDATWNPQPRRAPGNPDAPRFLILNHFYDQDIDAYLQASMDCGIWLLDWQMVNGVRPFFGPVPPGLDVDSTGPVMSRQTRLATKHFVRQAVDRIIRDARPDVVITPSSIFFWFRPFMYAFQAAGVPVICQDKEGTRVDNPAFDDDWAMVVDNYPQDADAYYFWGPVQADAWANAGMDRAQMRQLGMPRSDFFRHPDRFPRPSDLGLPDDKRLVTFFTFEANVYLQQAFLNTEKRNGLESHDFAVDRPWLELRREVHQALVRFAQSHPAVHVVVKCHPQSPEVEEIRAELAGDVTNLTIMTGAATGASLIVLSDVIVGFQSTALIEAMLTDKPIVYAGWAKDHERFYPFLIPILDSGACFAPTSQAEFAELLNDLIDRGQAIPPQMLDDRERFTSRYFVDPDGTTADRVLGQAVAEFVPRVVTADPS